MTETDQIIIDNTMKGIVELTKIFLKNYVGESPYSECRLQEGYNDYLRIEYGAEKICFLFMILIGIRSLILK